MLPNNFFQTSGITMLLPPIYTNKRHFVCVWYVLMPEILIMNFKNNKYRLGRRMRPADGPRAWAGSVSNTHVPLWGFVFSGIGMGMTVPISFAVFPSADGSLQKKLKVWFRIPNEFQSDPPAPSDDSIKIEDREGITVYST